MTFFPKGLHFYSTWFSICKLFTEVLIRFKLNRLATPVDFSQNSIAPVCLRAFEESPFSSRKHIQWHVVIRLLEYEYERNMKLHMRINTKLDVL